MTPNYTIESVLSFWLRRSRAVIFVVKRKEFTGGTKKNPTYEEVVTGTTGHAEAVQVT